jgi:hypothetical protein
MVVIIWRLCMFRTMGQMTFSFSVLGFEIRTCHLLGKCSTTWTMSLAQMMTFLIKEEPTLDVSYSQCALPSTHFVFCYPKNKKLSKLFFCHLHNRGENKSPRRWKKFLDTILVARLGPFFWFVLKTPFLEIILCLFHLSSTYSVLGTAPSTL